MHPVILKTFGGLSTRYYIRQFLFGLVFPAFVIFVLSHSPEPRSSYFFMVALFALNAVLYPYSRFVYESIVGYIMGENVFLVNALLMLWFKLMTMTLCWAFAIFVAPIGLLGLYCYHCRRSAS